MAGRKPGTPKTGGRKKGSQNKTTLAAKDAIALCADRLGGVDRMVAWAGEDAQNERVFWSSMYPKLMPVQVNAGGGMDINIRVSYDAGAS